jgi:trehalose 6-phosphate synthase/phosphatase
MAFEQGTPDRLPPEQPNPEMVGPGLSTMGEGAYRKASTSTPTVVSDGKDTDHASYFSHVPGTATTTKDAYVKSPASPGEAVSGATSGPELLRRLSLVGGSITPATPVLDPRAAHPGLQLTGRLISAAFCMPYKVAFQPDSDWVCLQHRNKCRSSITLTQLCHRN